MFVTPGSRAGRKTANHLRQGYFTPALQAGVIASGTFTPDATRKNIQSYTNGGAHTLAPPSLPQGAATTIIIDILNNASAGAITTSGWVKDGDAFDTTNGHGFRCYCSIGPLGAHLNVKRMI